MNKENFSKNGNLRNALELGVRGHRKGMLALIKDIDVIERAQLKMDAGDLKGAAQELESGFNTAEYIKSVVEGSDYARRMQKINGSTRDQRGQVAMSQRAAMSVATTGGNLVGTGLRIDLMEFKYRVSLAEKIFVTIDEPESGQNALIPVLTTPPSVIDVEENVAIGSIDEPKLEARDTKPKLMLSLLEMSQKLAKQLTDTTKEMLNDLLSFVILDGASYRIFYGTGASGQAEGLFYNSDVEVIDGSSFTEAKGYELIRRVDDQEAPSENRFFVVGPLTAEILKKRACTSGGDRRIIEKGKLLDENYVVSKLITEGHLWYGYFGTVVLSLWPKEILIDPFNSALGNIIIKQWQPYEVTVRHPGWVVAAEDVD